MRITIAYMFYNLLNLYGENGNIKILKKTFESMGINVMIKFLDVTDKLEFDKYDLIYMGSGNSDTIELIIKNLKKYKKELKDYIENNKFILITGNSLDMFGSYILKNNKKIKGLEIFNYFVKEEDIVFNDKALFKTKLIDSEIIGFQKRRSLMYENKYKFFEVIDGISDNLSSKNEGVLYKNFYGTYLNGPFLIRNPDFLMYLVNKIVLNKDDNYQLKELDLHFEKQAYLNFLNYNYGIKKNIRI